MNRFHFNNQNSGKHTLLLLLFYVLITAIFLSDFMVYPYYVILPITIFWIPYVILSFSKFNYEDRRFIIVSVLYLIMISAYYFLGISKIGRPDFVRNIVWIMAGMIALWVMRFMSNKELNALFVVFSIVIFVMMLIYIRIGRRLAALESISAASTTATAHTGSMLMLMSGVCMIAVMNIKRIIPRLLFAFLCVLTLYLNFTILQRGTNVIFTISEIAIIFVFSLKKKSLVWLLTIIIGVALIFVVSTGMAIDFFEWLADVIPSPRLASRFDEIATAMYYEDIEASSGSLRGRSNLMWNSWNTFTYSFSHFLFGVGENTSSNSIVGNHSHILDTLASYGMIGAVLMFSLFKQQYRIYISVLDKKTDWALFMQCAVVFAFYIARNFYGNLSSSAMSLLIILYFPMTFKVILHYKQKQEKLQIQLL